MIPAVRRRLEDEPLLAARIVVEDCLCLLLDVDDIDRMWAASDAQRDNKASLRKRRALLVEVCRLSKCTFANHCCVTPRLLVLAVSSCAVQRYSDSLLKKQLPEAEASMPVSGIEEGDY